MDAATPAQPDYLGHRDRLRQRLLVQGGEALQDYELLEYILGLVILRRDTKPLAKALLREFGSLSAVLAANPAELSHRTKRTRDPIFPKDGLSETVIGAIKVIQMAYLRAGINVVREQPILGSWQALLDYLRADMGHLRHERVRALYLDSKNKLLRDEVMSEGSVDQSAIYVREVVKRALELGATAIVLVHNHPSGEASPSRQDIAITRDIIEACKRFSIGVHDHVIIAGDTHISLKAQGLI
jgi:DNA repair protein RadC